MKKLGIPSSPAREVASACAGSARSHRCETDLETSR